MKAWKHSTQTFFFQCKQKQQSGTRKQWVKVNQLHNQGICAQVWLRYKKNRNHFAQFYLYPAIGAATLFCERSQHQCSNGQRVPEKMHTGWPGSKSNMEGFTVHPKLFCKVVRHSQTESRS